MSIQEMDLAGTGEYEGEYEGEFGEYEGEYEGEGFLGDILGTVLGSEMETPLSEAAEYELASELLEITSEQELEQFLGNIFRSVGGFINSPVGRALGGVLKNVAKKALPVVGGALGSVVMPGIGTTLGSKLGHAASGMFEVELEAVPAEAAEFEVARRFVNLAASSAHHAAMARPRPGVSPRTTARAAVAAGARHHAPGVYRVMIRTLAPSAAARPMGTGLHGVRRSPTAGRPGYRGVPGRPAPRIVPRTVAAGHPARLYPTWYGPRYGAAYPAAVQRRRPARGAPAYRGRRGYGWGYGDWYTPRYWGEPWTDGGYYYSTDGAPAGTPAAAAPRMAARRPGRPGGRAPASGRWVRRGRHIVLYGI